MSAPSIPTLLVSHWRWSSSLDIAAGLYAAAYLWGALRLRGRWPAYRTASFLGGIACVLVALQSGLDEFDDQLLSVHMAQHMLLLLLAPLLLVGGRPVVLALRALPPGRRPALARLTRRMRALTGPLQCLVAFSAVVVLTHLPAFYDATLSHPALHVGEHALYLFAGALIWWPILDVDPAPAHRLGGLGKLVYLLAAMVPMALVGAYLNRHPTLIYAAYGQPARSLGISALVDQAQAGAIMWVLGSVIMIAVALWAAMASLVVEERRQQAREARALGAAIADSSAEQGAAQ